MAQWVKNLTSVDWVTEEVGVCSLARSSGLKHLVQLADAGQIQSLVLELPYTTDVAIKLKK